MPRHTTTKPLAPRSLSALLLGLGVIAIATLTACENSNSPDRVTAPSNAGDSSENHSADHDHDHDDHDGHDHADHAHDHQDHASDATPAADPAPSKNGRIYAADFSFPIPEGWTERPPSNSMRLLEVAGPKPADAAPAVAAFSLAGGDIAMNIDRWQGQFAEPDAGKSRETREIAGTTVHLVEMAGSFRGMGGPVQTDTVMRAAIFERPGRPNLFIKMTGKSAAMEAAASGWAELLDAATSP